jgi:serine/threonine-protein kinase
VRSGKIGSIVDVVGEPSRSRTSLRAPWSVSGSEAESRVYLQSRLTLLFRLMFWSFVALLAFLEVLYTAFDIAPKYNSYVYLISAGGLAIMAFLWRVLLVRRKLTLEQLHGIDLFYVVGTGTVFAASAAIAFDFKPSAYTCLTYQCFAVLTRSLIVPSTGRRTMITSALSFLPMGATAVLLSFVLPVEQDVPPAPFIVGFVVVGGVAVIVSAAGSQIIYGLRRQARVAQQLGQYTLVRKIGEGGMGAVYLAHHVMLRRPTAVKLLLPDRLGSDAIERFEREVQHMSQLSHPNTVVVFDYGRSPDGEFYYAMEYLGGGIDLERLVRLHGPQPSGRVAHILAQVCGALQEAHDRGLIHRDIKPPNIILCERGGMPDVAKVVDFGLVKELTADSGASMQLVMATPAYIAPEHVADPGAIGPATDIYALGAVGYFLLTGQRVFEGKTAVDVCLQHATAVPVPPSERAPVPVAPALEAIVLRCLAKRPADRFASAAELGTALRAVAPGNDWDLARARAWWRERDTASDEIATEAPPESMIMIDLNDRATESTS